MFYVDLLLAAEVGKSLLEHNQNLKSDYNELLQKIKDCEEETRLYSIKSIHSDNEEDDNTMHLLPSKDTYKLMIETLERLNEETQYTLEQTQQEADITNQANLQKQRKLEQEIKVLKDHLEIAAQKVEELEEQNRLQQERTKQLENKQHLERRKFEDLRLLEELTVQMESLFTENQQLHSSKKSVEEKLLRTMQDLETIRRDFESFELTQQNYEALKAAFDRQKLHIRELNDSLEEHRMILSQLRDKGVWSSGSSATPSLSGHQSLFSTCLSKQSLMGELENAWCKKYLPKEQDPPSSNSSSISSKLQDFASKTERSFSSFCNAPADYAIETMLSAVGHRSILEETTELLKSVTAGSSVLSNLFEPEGNGSVYAECNIYPKVTEHRIAMEKPPKKGLLQLLQMQLKYLFNSLFQWCRFAIVLTAAVLINLWKGPRLLLLHK